MNGQLNTALTTTVHMCDPELVSSGCDLLAAWLGLRQAASDVASIQSGQTVKDLAALVGIIW